MTDRLRIVVEFKKTDLEELKLYQSLLDFSSPGAIIKDILKNKLPVGILYSIEDFEKEEQ